MQFLEVPETNRAWSVCGFGVFELQFELVVSIGLPNYTVGRGTMTATCEFPFFLPQKKISYYFAEISTRSHVASHDFQHPLSRKILLSYRYKGGPSKHHTHIENFETAVSHSDFTGNPHLGTHNRPNDYPSKLISTCIVAFTQKSNTEKSYSISTCIVRSHHISIIESQETLLSKTSLIARARNLVIKN